MPPDRTESSFLVVFGNMKRWIEWTTLVANCASILGFVVLLASALYARTKFLNTRKYDEYVKVYGLANNLFRAGLTIQKRKKDGNQIHPDDKQRVFKATNQLANWYYDNRFLFCSDSCINELMKKIDDEADQIISTGCIDDLVELKTYLEKRLQTPP